ncbi:hydantoinase/oxoprolinase family protein [Bradyrhizobium sp. KB893862 SZCCT0404]|uniref:hydantoinase/oxoprolinase family protein n=1 Tax=Bradyrhizobium sp. KB893862 SZCCT0404 TaxID=2807672 RepID=UPI001BA8FC22|nr:hydantoinase/oxoprolinase family protein [Bradyrhizobium sp. KB893862 SZCCT0404]MBR1172759.1 hydantoinase/oxoprolinase family protein [Bradyrhizobium sp. KB893862 SZCCT0404]
MSHFIAADTGGTFTDVAVYDAARQKISFAKSLTTYGDLVDGVVAGIDEAKGDFGSAVALKHGTTHVINAFLQRKGARAALVCTRGFRDVIELARGNRPAPFDIAERREAPLIARALRFELTERISPTGAVIQALDEDEVVALASTLRDARVSAVAVSFLNSYANPAHEQRTIEMLGKLLPGVYFTSGSALSREWFEYERSTTAAANAYVGPAIATYAAGFTKCLRDKGFGGDLAMMGSNGGIMSFEAAVERPVALVESGPIGGVIAAAEYARALGLNKVVAFDMGGTTAKCALVEDGSFAVQPTYWVGGYVRGFPIRSPVLDIVEVGAGGGSIGWTDAQRRLRVGPRSAGSEPGPACFGRGGTEPTVTDANLRLGRIGGGSFLGGRLSLDGKAAETAIRDRVAVPLGYGSGEEAITRVAHGILDLATTLMAGAVKEITVARGYDVREFALLVFGGGGPIFGAELARNLGIRRVVVPPEPGNFSALGMLMANARVDLAQSIIADLSESGIATLVSVRDKLRQDIQLEAERELTGKAITYHWQADMRYRGQRHSIPVDFNGDPSANGLKESFEAAYRKRFGRMLGHDFKPEVVGLRVSAESAGDRPSLKVLSPGLRGAAVAPAPASHRPMHLRPGGWVDVPVWKRDHLPVGWTTTGPAVIEEYGSTTLVGPGDVATVGALGELTIAVAGHGAER